MLYFVYGLLGLAVLIALMGIGNTLSLSIHERTRELGLLRAVGQTPLAAALDGALGVGDRRRVRHARRPRPRHVPRLGPDAGAAGRGGLRRVRLPVVPLAVILGLAAVAGVVAALRPARRAARLDILAAIADGLMDDP